VLSSLDRPALGMLKEIRKAQYKGTVMMTQSAFSSLFTGQPPELLEGVYRYAQADLPSSLDPKAKEFVKAVETRSGRAMAGFNQALSYDVVMVSKQVIERANLKGDAASRADDRKKFVDGLNALKDYQGLTGKMSMTKDGHMEATPTVLVFRKDRWTPLQ
jgi:ABC-type branched-subunit amino acid transport system substrate-binding protein